MVLSDRRLALVFRILAALIAAWGIVRVANLFTDEPSSYAFLFFTVQSNVLCLVWLVAGAIVTGRDLAARGPKGISSPSPRAAGYVVMAITTTMLVYTVVLAPMLFDQPGSDGLYSLTDSLVHVITPIVTILDWLLFTQKGTWRWYDPPLWALVPLAYLVFAFAYGAAGGTFFEGGGRYPYPFMNVEELGVGGVAIWILVLTIVLEIVAFVLVAIDRALGALARRRNRTRISVSA